DPAHDLLQLIGVPTLGLLGDGLFEGGDDLGPDRLEHLGVLRHAARVDLRAGDQRAGPGVDHGEQGDEALVTEDAAVLEVGLGDLPHARAVHVHIPVGHLADGFGDPVPEVDDVAVPGQHDAFARHPGRLRDPAVGDEVAHLAVDRHHVLRAHDVVAVQQLALARVPAGVDRRVPLVEHLGAEFHQPVDPPEHGV